MTLVLQSSDSTPTDSEIRVEDRLDRDDDLKIEVINFTHDASALVFLEREDVKRLRNHLDYVLNENPLAGNHNRIASLLREVADAIQAQSSA